MKGKPSLNRPETLRKFVAPEFVFGVGARLLAARYAVNLGATKILVVSDPGVMAAGWTAELIDGLKQAGFPLAIFTGVSPSPPAEQVMAGAEIFRSERCNAIVAIGGGSPMDCAKGIGVVAAQERHILEFEGVDQVSAPIPPLICIPTTGGTSADVSQFAIITDRARSTKIAIVSKAIVPDIALIDPSTLTTMPESLAAATGMDAVTHAFESFVSNAQSPLTDLLALEAARLLFRFLPESIREPGNIDYRTQVMLGSLNAGLAFSNASLGAVHAMAHAAGGLLDLPHGDANSILLPHVIRYNFEAVPERYRKLAQVADPALAGASGMTHDEIRDALIDRLRTFQVEIKAPLRFEVAGITPATIAKLASLAMADPCMATNPKEPDLRDIERIYEKSF